MTELVAALPPGSRVLDLGARTGSFHSPRNDLIIVRADLEIPPAPVSGTYVAADAARLPFASGAFALIISNHSLEHFADLEATLRETGRVLGDGGGLYIAVPDAGTLTDRIYRWLGKGGGHINAFRQPQDVIGPVETLAGVPCRGWRALYSGLSFLNRRNFTSRAPRKIAFFGFGNERFLAALVWLLRAADRRLGTRWSHYGWALYFGSARASADEWVNVCVRCGAGHSIPYLEEAGVLRRWIYRCPACGGWNLATR